MAIGTSGLASMGSPEEDEPDTLPDAEPDELPDPEPDELPDPPPSPVGDMLPASALGPPSPGVDVDDPQSVVPRRVPAPAAKRAARDFPATRAMRAVRPGSTRAPQKGHRSSVRLT